MLRQTIAGPEVAAADTPMDPPFFAVFGFLLFTFTADIQLTANGFNFQFALFPARHAERQFIAVIAQPPDIVRRRGGQRRTAG